MKGATSTVRSTACVASALSILLATTILGGCASIEKRAMALKPGMSPDQVIALVGTPTERSFRGNDEAWQYQDLVGFGQCAYLTAWISNGHLIGVNSRRGVSVAGCGLGSRSIDWGQMPRPQPDREEASKSGD